MSFDWDEKPELNITPLVDIMLVLMAILMVTAPVMVYKENITLPSGSAKQSVKKVAELTIRVDKNKNIYIKDKKFNFNDFADNFLLLSKDYDKKAVVYIKADKDLKYDDVMYILKVAKKVGFLKVALLTNG